MPDGVRGAVERESQARHRVSAKPTVALLSIAANDAHRVTWCRMQELCINSDKEHYSYP
jgi:hypothetical protein